MTYKEKVLMDHPEAKTDKWAWGVIGCPVDYGYPDRCDSFRLCQDCWGAEFPVPVEEQKHRIKVMLDPGARMPTRAHDTDAGLDLYAMDAATIPPRGIVTISTGAHAAIPAGYCGLLTSKSGLMAKGVTSRGTIDCGYTGTIQAVLFNHRKTEVNIERHQKITQMVIVPILTPDLELVDSLEETERGNGGFGSSGKF